MALWNVEWLVKRDGGVRSVPAFDFLLDQHIGCPNAAAGDRRRRANHGTRSMAGHQLSRLDARLLRAPTRGPRQARPDALPPPPAVATQPQTRSDHRRRREAQLHSAARLLL